MITKRSVRQISVSARWSIRFALFALTLLIVSVMLHRLGQIETGPFVGVLALSASIAALGLGLAVAGLAALWLHGHEGGRRAAAALALCLCVLSPFGLALHKAVTLPMIADISTDLSDPPLFAESLVTGLRPEQQAAAYPDVTGRRYPVAGEFLLALIERQIREFGWRLIERGGVTGGSGEMLVEAEVTTPIAGFKDRIVVRVTDEGDTAYVDMRSRSSFGEYDMGANASRIAKFMQALDLAAALAPAVQTGK